MASMTIEMLVARVESLEAQVVLLLKKGQDVPKSDGEVSGGDQEVVSKKEKKEKKEKKAKKSDDDEVAAGDKEVVSKKTTKKIKEKKDETSSDDEDKPKKKRGTNGYILFSNSNREDACAKLLVGTEKPKNTEVMKQLAQMWRELGDEEKEIWNTKAKEANAGEVN